MSAIASLVKNVHRCNMLYKRVSYFLKYYIESPIQFISYHYLPFLGERLGGKKWLGSNSSWLRSIKQLLNITKIF